LFPFFYAKVSIPSLMFWFSVHASFYLALLLLKIGSG
jgi:hypothetical protein